MNHDIIREARRARSAALTEIFRAIGRAAAGLGRDLAAPLVATDAWKALELAAVRRREFRRARAELLTYSDRELMTDLRLVASEIPDIAAEAADIRVEAFVRANPRYRAAWRASRGGALARA